MTSTRPEAWETVLLRIAREPITAIAADTGIEEFEIIARLVVDGAGLPAERAPWWPEALRMRAAGEPIRAIARRFQTDPRRVRRALARLSLRVKGEDIPVGEAPAALAGVRERLGSEPDAVLAKAAGVAPEAIKGERTRLGIPGHVQRRRVKLTADDEAWIRGPRKIRRERVRTEPEALHVVRRPSARFGGDVRRPEGDGRAGRLDTPRAGGFAPRADARRDFFRNDHQAEIERLLEPTTRREGPRRLVRAGDARPVGSPEPRPPTVSVRGEGERPTLRSVPPPTDRPRTLPASARDAGPVPPPPSLPGLRSVPSPVAATAESVQSPAAQPDDVDWHVQVPGWSERVTVRAPDIVTALARAAERVPSALLARASIWRADGPTPGGEWTP